MKLDPRGPVAQVAASKAAQPFKKLLAEAKSELAGDKKPLPIKQASLTANATATSASVRTATQTSTITTTARARANTEASRLSSVRSDHAELAHSLTQSRVQHTEAIVERSESRVIDFILRELGGEATASNSTPPPTVAAVHQLPVPQSQGAQVSKTEATPEAKASQAVALIEKIETFVKSQRPGLALTLNNSLGASVEIERIGPREIALKVVGHRGPPSADAISRIRDELRARGLKIGALSVA